MMVDLDHIQVKVGGQSSRSEDENVHFSAKNKKVKLGNQIRQRAGPRVRVFREFRSQF